MENDAVEKTVKKRRLQKNPKFFKIGKYENMCSLSYFTYDCCFIHNFDFVACAWKIKYILSSFQVTVKKTLSDFRRTHHDNWQYHREKFTSDQLSSLTDLLISPSYYAQTASYYTLVLEIPSSCGFHIVYVGNEKVSLGQDNEEYSRA